MADEFTEFYNRLFFLNAKVFGRTVNIYNEKTQSWRKERQIRQQFKELACPECSRTFHKQYGLFNHVTNVHKKKVARPGPTVSASPKASEPNGSNTVPQSSEGRSHLHPDQAVTFDAQTWPCVSQLPEFQPFVWLDRDPRLEKRALRRKQKEAAQKNCTPERVRRVEENPQIEPTIKLESCVRKKGEGGGNDDSGIDLVVDLISSESEDEAILSGKSTA